MLNTVAKDVEKNNSLIWFRNDLRTQDHSGLFHALKNSKKIIGVFCFNPENFKINALDFPKTDSFRANFLIESLVYFFNNCAPEHVLQPCTKIPKGFRLD